MSIELVIPFNHLILCRHLLLLPSVFPSIRVFSNESALHISWPNYWSFCFSNSPSNEYSELISFRIDWFDLLAVQVTLKFQESSAAPHTPTYLLEWQKLSLAISSAIKDVKQMELSYTEGGNVNLCNHFGKKVEEFLQKLNICQYIIQPFPSLHIYLGEIKTYIPTEACTKHP